MYCIRKKLSALKNMKNNKTPWNEGFTVESFKFFWNVLKSYMYMVSAIQCTFWQKDLPISQRRVIISCLPKGDKPKYLVLI